ncbi:hypothetical protein AYO45_00630 [Gammaproteobacteria bacterium SCGC AG-212-F23]|nr:hypothetical protein AYO45_00630 [Gammaproteobacteria bacterium SCGC AG-212-F23]
MSKIITHCPSCDSAKLHAVRIECADCGTAFEGRFDIPALLKFAEEDLQFILDFVKCSGSLKDMAAKRGISYPTLRNRLNTLIENIENLQIQKEGSKTEILKLLEQGKISAKDAAKMLHKL